MTKLFKLLLSFLITSQQLWSIGAKKPPTDPQTPPQEKKEFTGNYFVQPESINFTFKADKELSIRPQCLKAKGINLIVLDPGHDDSSSSRRSDAKVPGGDGTYKFLWPEIHEGQLNMVTAYLTYEYLMGDPSLSKNEKGELQSMLRSTRLPGESTFGQYENEATYGSSGGTINSGVTYRQDRVNQMMSTHRPYDSKTNSYSKNKIENVENQTLMVSVHANSSEYFGSGDYIWPIPPRNAKAPSDTANLLRSMKMAFSSEFTDFLSPRANDDDLKAQLRRNSIDSAREENIITKEHSKNLAMLSAAIRTPYVLLTEGFVMNGRVGHLAYLDIKENPKPKKLIFKRKGQVVREYAVTETYMTYARSLAKGIRDYLNCD